MKFQSGHTLFLRKIRCALVRGETDNYCLEKCHRLKEVCSKNQVAPWEEGYQEHRKCPANSPSGSENAVLADLSFCSAHAFRVLNMPYFIFFWSLLGTSHPTLPAAYIPRTTPHIHTLPGHLKCTRRLRGFLFVPQVLVWFSICLPVTLWGPVGRLPWQRLPHCVLSLGDGLPFFHLLLKPFAP